MSKDPVSTQTSENAQGKEAVYEEAQHTIYYDPFAGVLVYLTPAQHKQVIDEHNYLSSVIENVHTSNAKLHAARQKCADAVTKSGVQHNAPNAVLQAFYDAEDEAIKNHEEMRKVFAALGDLEKVDQSSRISVYTTSGVAKISELFPIINFKEKTGRVDIRDGGGSSAGGVRYVRSTIGQRGNWSTAALKKEEFTDAKGNINPQQLKQQIIDRKPSFDVNLDLSKILPENWQERDLIVTTWAKEWSDAATTGEQSFFDGKVTFDAAAQFMRLTHGATFKSRIDLTKGQVGIKAEGGVAFSLIEGRAKASYHIPDARGWMLSIPSLQGRNGDLGLIRFSFTFELSGSIGASLAVEAGVKIDGGRFIGQAEDEGQKTPDPTNKFNLEEKLVEGENARAGLEAFAGARATAAFAASFEWFSPEEKTPNYVAFAKAHAGLSGLAGAGVAASFKVGFDKDGLYVEAKAGFCWGLGASGSLKFRVDVNNIFKFMAWFVHQLRNADFAEMLGLMDKDDFKNLSNLGLVLAYGGLETIRRAILTTQYISDQFNDMRARADLADRIIAKPDLLQFSTPETKGMVIANLLRTGGFFDAMFGAGLQDHSWYGSKSFEIGPYQKVKQAILLSLKWVQSRSEYRNILQHLNPEQTGQKRDWKVAEKTLFIFLSYGEVEHWSAAWATTNYARLARETLESLPEDSVPGQTMKPNPNFSDQVTMRQLAQLADHMPQHAQVGFKFKPNFTNLQNLQTTPPVVAGVRLPTGEVANPLFWGDVNKSDDSQMA